MKDNIIYTPKKNNETVLWKKGRVKYITFPALDQYQDQLVNAFSTCRGGFSKGIYKSMNLGFAGTDSKENILFNYMEFCKAIGINHNNLVISNQKHTTIVCPVTAQDRGIGISRPRDTQAVDGFITNESGVALCLLFADCVPVYLYDPVDNAIGLVHSGWKGTVGQISAEAIRLMGKEYGTHAENVICCIGPSICQDCYEVSADLYEAFSKEYSEDEMKAIFLPGKDAEHYQLSLWKAIETTLRREGVKPENIHVTDICTCHNPDLLFSHRFTQGKRGNLAAVLMLKPEPPEDPQLFKNLLPTFRK